MVIQTRPFHVDFIQVDPVERPLKPVIEAFAPKLDALRTLVQESPEVIEHNELTYVVVIYPFKEYRSL